MIDSELLEKKKMRKISQTLVLFLPLKCRKMPIKGFGEIKGKILPFPLCQLDPQNDSVFFSPPA